MTISFQQAFGGGGTAEVWTSGMTVNQWQYVVSPIDGETYQRITATGSGTTDPADDYTNYAAKSWLRVSALPLPNVVGFASSLVGDTWWAVNARTRSDLPAISAGVRTLLYSATGRGCLQFAQLWYSGDKSGTFRIEILRDGRTLLDTTISFPSVSGTSGVIVPLAGAFGPGPSPSGTVVSSGVAIPDDTLQFRRGVSIYITPSAAQTAAWAKIATILEAQA